MINQVSIFSGGQDDQAKSIACENWRVQFNLFRSWAARHPSDESARCLLDLAYLERHPDDQALLPLFIADFHKLEAKLR